MVRRRRLLLRLLHNGVAPVAPAAVATLVAPSAVGVDLVAQMLDVVADKTGYPVEMLDLSMALESDLGIDSIKRVEILSAVQERVPSLPDVETATMAALTTLQEIVDYLESLITPVARNGGAAAPAAPAALDNGVAPVAPAAVATLVAPSAVGVDLVAQMLDVVADKTGYPVEMLDLSMALESDLGIDSIKRVEILSAVQERVPSLPDVETATMAALTTLQEIVDYLESLITPVGHNGGAAVPVSAAVRNGVAPVRAVACGSVCGGCGFGGADAGCGGG